MRLLLTGQHSLDPAEHGLAGVPMARLDWRASGMPERDVAQLTALLQPAIGWSALVLVQGDTSSALAGTLAANERGVAVAHVEAGLRTHDSSRPWPEEEFRARIDRLAAMLFAPTELSAANLRRERVGGEIHVTGNTAIDALRAYSPADKAGRRILVTCHRRESWGEGLERIAEALRRIAGARLAEMDFVLHPNPRVAGQMRRLLGGAGGIRLRAACPHDEMLAAMRSALLVLSDSGGMQEEASALGVPLLILREATERPEAIVSGNLLLVGTDPDRIEATIKRLLDRPELLARMRVGGEAYGDGLASERIARVVERWLLGRPGQAPSEALGGQA